MGQRDRRQSSQSARTSQKRPHAKASCPDIELVVALELMLRSVSIIGKDLLRVEKKLDRIAEKVGARDTDLIYRKGEYVRCLDDITTMCKNLLGTRHPLVKGLKRWH